MVGDARDEAYHPAELELENIYSILGNVHKRRIIMFLGEHGTASFSELKRALKISVGNLYYNIDGLAGFVAKSEDRKYYLTEKGEALYNFLLDQEARIKTYLSGTNAVKRYLDKFVLPVIVPRSIISFLYKQREISLIAILVSLLLGAVSTIYTPSSFLLLEVLDQAMFSPATKIFLLLGSLAGIIAVIEMSSHMLGAPLNLRIDFIGGIALSLVPIFISPLVLNTLIPAFFLRSLFFRIFQVITLGLLTASISVFKNIPLEKSFIAVFVLYYISYTIYVMYMRI